MPSLLEIVYLLLSLLVIALVCGLVVKWLYSVLPTRRLLPPQRHFAVPWNGVEVSLVLLSILLLPAAISRVLLDSSFLDWVYGSDFSRAFKARDTLALDRVAVWGQALYIPVQVVFILGLLRLVSGTRPYQLGLTLHHAPANVALGAMTWLLVTPAVFVLNIIVSAIYALLVHGPPDQHPITELVQGKALPVDWALLVLMSMVAAPVEEELLFRGVLQRWLCRRSWGGDAAMCGAFLIALLARGTTLQEAIEAGDPSYILHELAPALFVLMLIPGYVTIDRWAGRFFPVPRRFVLPRPANLSVMPLPGETQIVAERLEEHRLDGNRLGKDRDGLTPGNTARGIYGTAALFAMFHSGVWPSPIPLFVLALVLGWLAYRTQSLLPSFVLHALFNGVTCVLLILSPFFS